MLAACLCAVVLGASHLSTLDSRPCPAGGPTWLQWAFACVRSRAFKLADECFAFVPFLDVANHEEEPSCDFR